MRKMLTLSKHQIFAPFKHAFMTADTSNQDENENLQRKVFNKKMPLGGLALNK
jgi:hypothetical protein